MEAFHRDRERATKTAGRLSIETIGDGRGTRAIRAPPSCKDPDLSRSREFDVLLQEKGRRVQAASGSPPIGYSRIGYGVNRLATGRRPADHASVRYHPTMHSHAPTMASINQSH